LSGNLSIQVTIAKSSVVLRGWFRCFQKENVEALLKEANNFPLEFEELPRLQQLAYLGKVPGTLIFLFVQVFVHT